MSTPDRTPKPQPSRPGLVLATLFGLTVVVSAWLLMRPHNPSLAKGFLIGGFAMVLVLAVVFFRGRARAGHSLTRSITDSADERDRAVLQSSLAVAGGASIAWMSAAAVALGVGAPVAPVTAVMLWGQLVTLVAAYGLYARRL